MHATQWITTTHYLLFLIFLVGLEENKRLLTDMMRKAGQEALKRIEENKKLKDEIRGSKICSGLLVSIFH